MKIIFDTDGTLTDFNKFVKDNAINYFVNEYGMEIKYPNELEIEDIFDIMNMVDKKLIEDKEGYISIPEDKLYLSNQILINFIGGKNE